MSRRKVQKAAHKLRRKLELLLKQASNGDLQAKAELEELSQSIEIKRMLSTIKAGKAPEKGFAKTNDSKLRKTLNTKPMQGGAPGLGKRK